MDQLNPSLPVSAPARRKLPLTRRIRRWFRKLHRDQRGTTSLEWALLLGAIALPCVWLMTICMGIVVDYYRMMTMLNSMPMP